MKINQKYKESRKKNDKIMMEKGFYNVDDLLFCTLVKIEDVNNVGTNNYRLKTSLKK